MNKSTGGGRTDALRREAKRLLPKKRLGDNPRLKLRAEILHEALSASETGAELSRRALASVGEEILQDSPATKGHGNETKAKAGPPAFREAPAERLPHNAAGRAELLRRVQEQGNPPLQDRFTDSEAPVDKYRKTSYKRGMDGLTDYLKSRGVPESLQPKLAAKLDAWVTAEITGRTAAPKLSEADLAAFMAHAAANQWNPKSGVAASAHIKTKFAEWLGRGLMLEQVRAAQKNLATAYSSEVTREPSNRIKELGTRPHTRHSKEPAKPDAPKTTGSGWIPVSELTEEQATARREAQAANKRVAYARQHAPQ
jgi:hypothetical protein